MNFKQRKVRIKNNSISVSKNLPNLANQTAFGSKGFGGTLIQNWYTKNDIPEELKGLETLPIIVDKNKILQKKYALPPLDPKLNNEKLA
jgi:hypothetical protein